MPGRPPEPDDEREPAPDGDDIDVRFADITASLGDLTVPPDERTEDASEQRTREPGTTDEPRSDPADAGPRDYTLPSSAGPLGDPEAADDDERGYVPPEPPPIAGTDPLLGLAWTGVLVPIGLVIVYLVLWRAMPRIVLGLAGVVFVLAVALLVWRMPGKRDPGDADDGAVV
jgi:hypothetical protein